MKGKTMGKDGFIRTINNQRYWFPYGTTEDKTILDSFFKNKSLTKLVSHSLFGTVATDERKRFRKLFNQIIRAKNNPENNGLKTITVKLSGNKNIKVTSLDMRCL